MTDGGTSGKICNKSFLIKAKKLLLLLILWMFFWKEPAAPIFPQTAVSPRIQRVVIDAGHGGKDSGAIYPAGLLEKDLTLDVAQKVRSGLVGKGLRVIMTRDTDVFIPLPNRSKVSQKKDADLFVSIHANASVNKSLRGLEVYSLSELSREQLPVFGGSKEDLSGINLKSLPVAYADRGLKRVVWLLKMAKDRLDSALLARWIAGTVAHSVPVAAHRVKEANFYVLRWAQCPAVLVEMGYGTNHQDEIRLKSFHYRTRLAESIVSGILNYKKEYEKTKGFSA